MRISWEDLQTVEALVRLGTVMAAAKELELRHSTVSRRIDALEQALATPLFLRGPRLQPTALARSIAERTGPMVQRAGEIEALVRDEQRLREERLVVSTNDVLAPMVFGALASGTLTQTVQVRISDEEEELAPGVVDLALRPGSQPRTALRGWRLGRLRVGLYRARSLSSSSEAWVLPAASLRARSSMRWWKAIPTNATGPVECDSLLALRDACVRGLGRAVFPSVLAAEDPRLVRIEELAPGPAVWLLASATRRGDKALRDVADLLVSSIRTLPDVWAA